MMPYYVYTGRHYEIIRMRKEVKSRYGREKTMIEVPGRGIALKVSTISKAYFVLLSLETYS